MNKLIFVSFLAGVAAGSGVTYLLVNKKAEARAQEDIDSVKEYFARREAKLVEKADKLAEKATPKTTEKPELSKYYKDAVKAFKRYSSKSERASNEEEETMEVSNKPYVITPDVFMNNDEYDTISLTYYADGVLADEYDEQIIDVEGTIGEDSLEHFGEYEDDSVFVRNDALKVDYEILLDQRLYSEVAKGRPTRVEV